MIFNVIHFIFIYFFFEISIFSTALKVKKKDRSLRTCEAN